MITGHFDLALKDAKGFGDEAFIEATRQGRLSRMLDDLPTELEAHTDNLVMDGIVLYLGFNLFQVGDRPNGVRVDLISGGGAAWFTSVCLMTTDSEPDYQSEWYRNGGYDLFGMSNVPESANSSTGGKRFKDDASETTDVRSDPGGRESVTYRDRWLYLPTQGTSSNIRSIAVRVSNNAQGFGNDFYIGRAARVRIKDGGGNPIIINKTTSQVLLVEYRLAFVSI